MLQVLRGLSAATTVFQQTMEICERTVVVCEKAAAIYKETTVSPFCCYVYLENIGFLYPAMSMVVIGHSLLY